jgi:N-acetylmuramoyl-L-alanine amidase
MDNRILSIAGIGLAAAFMVHTEVRMDKIEARIERLESRVDNIERQFDRIEKQLDRIEEKLDDIIQTKDTVKYTAKELECLTKNIYYEAGIEDSVGKYAVANVTINRLKTGKWGKDICQVVYAPKQFSWTSNKRLPKPNKELWTESQKIAVAALSGKRVRGLTDSLFYHATYINLPRWVNKEEHVVTIGRHVFYNRARIA